MKQISPFPKYFIFLETGTITCLGKRFFITKATSAPTNIKSFYYSTVLASPSAGIPSEKELVSTYCKLRGFSKTSFPNWNFYLALSFFRMAAIAQV